MVHKPKCLPNPKITIFETSESPFMAKLTLPVYISPHLHPPKPPARITVSHSTVGQEVTSQTPPPLHLLQAALDKVGNPSGMPLHTFVRYSYLFYLLPYSVHLTAAPVFFNKPSTFTNSIKETKGQSSPLALSLWSPGNHSQHCGFKYHLGCPSEYHHPGLSSRPDSPITSKLTSKIHLLTHSHQT